ncbi:hypothetical protein JCM11641_005504 [Rhodosporidiobolus odoratus]
MADSQVTSAPLPLHQTLQPSTSSTHTALSPGTGVDASFASSSDQVPPISISENALMTPTSPVRTCPPASCDFCPRQPIHRAVTSPASPSPTKQTQPSPLAKSGSDSLIQPSAGRGPKASLGAVDPQTKTRQQTSPAADPAGMEPPSRPKERVYLEKLRLYETKMKLYIIGSNEAETRYRVLKVDRVAPSRPATASVNDEKPVGQEVHDEEAEELSILEDPTTYTHHEIQELVTTLKAGNGGAIKVTPREVKRNITDHTHFYGLIGFVRLTSSYRLVLVTDRQKVAFLGGHYIWHSEGTLLYSITPTSLTTYATDDYKQEAAFSSVHLSKAFYFSYTYNLSHTLQNNLLRGRQRLPLNDKFVWNWHLLNPIRQALTPDSPWILPLMHGFVDQAKIEVWRRTVFVTLIARRSRHFAGARFLRRGINEQGWVANDVESEQIVSEANITPFHIRSSSRSPSAPAREISPRYTSWVQIRGSIPFHWTQDISKGVIKPVILMSKMDPYYDAAAQHFDQLFKAYGGPVVAMNLIKQSDNRESTLNPHFRECIRFLNQSLPNERQIEYIEFDMNTAKKYSKSFVNETLRRCAEETLERTQFFHSGPETPWLVPRDEELEYDEQRTTPMLQNGVVRTNCIDCIDRTNNAQTAIATVVLAHQLKALGILPTAELPADCDAVHLLEVLYKAHGDLLAIQYGGSATVSTIDSFKEGQGYTFRSRDKVESIKRLYTNAFSDADKQAAIDLFLGIAPAVPTPLALEAEPPPLRPLSQEWYTPANLASHDLDASEVVQRLRDSALAEYEQDQVDNSEEWFQRLYRTHRWTASGSTLLAKMDGTLKPPKHLYVFVQIRAYDALTAFGIIRYDPPISPFASRRPYLAVPPRLKKPPNKPSSSTSGHTPLPAASRHSHSLSSSTGLGDAANRTFPVALAASTRAAAISSAPIAQLATNLLTPRVRPQDKREYAAWATQFQGGTRPTDESVTEKDRQMYSQNASFTFKRASDRDVTVFEATTLAGQPVKTLSTGSEDVPTQSTSLYKEYCSGEGADGWRMS